LSFLAEPAMVSRLRWLLVLTFSVVLGCSQSGTRTEDAGALDGAGAFGRCGPEVHACVCAGATLSECLSREPDCSVCLSEHAETCCGPETSSYYTCVEGAQAPAGPCAADDAECISMECAAEAGALQTCLSSPACAAGMNGCTGTWPIDCS
jgi:hypothetical protein